jgi:starvation-inducible DNA-binding protein
MTKKTHTLSEEQQAKLIELLNRRLADAIDLQLQCRQAYWNVKGFQFMALRDLFDKIVADVEKDANLIAGRIVQLGGMAEGTARAVARRSSLDESLVIAERGRHIMTLSASLVAFGRGLRYACEQAIELKDTDTATIFTEIARRIDTWLWFVETSQQTDG